MPRSLLSQYNWYSAPHKYLRHALFEYLDGLGRANFSDLESVNEIKQDFVNIKTLLLGHGSHEEAVYHPLLKDEAPALYGEAEHECLDAQLRQIEALLSGLVLPKAAGPSICERVAEGRLIYLEFSSFYARYMQHLIQEERVLMPAMRQIHGVDKLREVTFTTYRHMTPQQMVDMLGHLYPCLNIQEKAVFLLDIGDSDAFYQEKDADYGAKFPFVWQQVQEQNLLSQSEISLLGDVILEFQKI